MKWFLIFTTLAVLAGVRDPGGGVTNDSDGVRDPGGGITLQVVQVTALPWHGPRGVWDPRIDGTVLR